MIVNKKRITVDELLTRILPYTGMMKDQVLKDMKMFSSEGKDYMIIFRDVEFTIAKEDVDKYLGSVKDLDAEMGEFDMPAEPKADELIPPPVKDPKTRREIPREMVVGAFHQPPKGK